MSRSPTLLLIVACLAASFVGGMAVTVLFAPGPTAEADDYKVLTANRFILLDTDGKARAALTSDKKSGLPKLMFLDGEGTVRLSLAVGPDGNPYVNLFNGAKQNAVDLSVKKDGSTALVMRGADGSTAGSWATVKAKDGNWYTVLESGLIKATMDK